MAALLAKAWRVVAFVRLKCSAIGESVTDLERDGRGTCGVIQAEEFGVQRPGGNDVRQVSSPEPIGELLGERRRLAARPHRVTEVAAGWSRAHSGALAGRALAMASATCCGV